VRIHERCSCQVELELEGDDDQQIDAHLARWRVNHMHCHGVELTREACAEYVAGHPWPDGVDGSLEWITEQYARLRHVHTGCGHALEGHGPDGCTVAGCGCRATRARLEGATVDRGDSWAAVRAEAAADVDRCPVCDHSFGVHVTGATPMVVGGCMVAEDCTVAGCDCTRRPG